MKHNFRARLQPAVPSLSGGPGAVDRERGLDAGGQRPVLHAAEDTGWPHPELHHPPDLPLHLWEQTHGNNRPGRWFSNALLSLWLSCECSVGGTVLLLLEQCGSSGYRLVLWLEPAASQCWVSLVIRPFPWSGMAMEIGGAGWAIRNENQNVLAGCAMNLGSSDDKQRCHVFSQISLFLES